MIFAYFDRKGLLTFSIGLIMIYLIKVMCVLKSSKISIFCLSDPVLINDFTNVRKPRDLLQVKKGHRKDDRHDDNGQQKLPNSA